MIIKLTSKQSINQLSQLQIELSFAGIDRESSVRARSFTPNYGAHFSMTLPTVMSPAHSGPPTLAENIRKGSVLVSVFHKVDGSVGKSNDILLCKVFCYTLFIVNISFFARFLFVTIRDNLQALSLPDN